MAFAKTRANRCGSPRRVLLATPRGFCAGVVRAIDAVERALATYGPPVYVRRPIVHNQAVIARLERLGAIFVPEVADVPEGAVLIVSAHGVARAVRQSAGQHRVLDATCPLVSKVHAHVLAQHAAGRHVLLIGHSGHPETVGTIGQVPAGSITLVANEGNLAELDLPARLPVAYAVQTTFSVAEARALIDAIEARFDDVVGPRAGNICYATTNRQSAIEAIAREADYVLVVGDASSSNANRLVEVAAAAGTGPATLIGSQLDLDWVLVEASQTIGMTAAASTPAHIVDSICDALAERGFVISEQTGVEEDVHFKPLVLDAP